MPSRPTASTFTTSPRPPGATALSLTWNVPTYSKSPGSWTFPAAEALAILDDSPNRPSPETGGPGAAGLRPGDRVVFTGDMNGSRAEVEALATAAGLIVTSAVSGKTTLVVAAEPYSQSGKARQARDRGIRLVTEQVFLHLLDGMRTAAAPVTAPSS